MGHKVAIMEAMKHIEIPGIVQVAPGPGDLSQITISNEYATASIFPYGAHVSSFVPKGGKDLFWMSTKSPFSVGKAIRGGVPLCWPWFSAHKQDKTLPSHGFARIHTWHAASAAQLADGRTRLVFTLDSTPETRTIWPHDFHAEYTVTVGSSLDLSLSTTNTGTEPFLFEEVLHSYFAVGDVRKTALHGFDQGYYLDRGTGDTPALLQGVYKPQAETTYLFEKPNQQARLSDPSMKRSLVMEHRGAGSCAVWNPFDTGAAKMPEVAEQWPEFLCVEHGNFLARGISLLPGYSHRLDVSYHSSNGA